MKRLCSCAGVLLMVVGCRASDGTKVPPPPPTTAPTESAANALASADAATMTPASPVATTASASGPRTWNFDSDTLDAPPAQFAFGRTGTGREGKWLVRAEPGAPSGPNVLAQTDADPTDNRFAVAFTVDAFPADVDLAVKCKPISGSVDRACGLVLRLIDTNNYYLTRANALENNVRLYFVKEGHRQQIASWTGNVTSGVWHAYRIVATGDHFEVYWDGAKILDHRDSTFASGGRVGVWTKADSVTYFDDLTARDGSAKTVQP